jgi:hypothetical protein
MAFCQLVAIKQNPCLPAITRLAAEQRMLTACDEADEIGPGAVRRGNGGIVLLDAPFHFLEKRLLERRRAGKGSLGIGVLRQQVTANILGEHRRIAHHLLPVHRSQPRIVVDPLNAVMNAMPRPPLGDWSGGARLCSILVHDAPAEKMRRLLWLALLAFSHISAVHSRFQDGIII